MSTPATAERSTRLGQWLALGFVAAALGVWLTFVALAPNEPPGADSRPYRGSPVVAQPEDTADGWLISADDSAQPNLNSGTATESPYSVMVAMAELEALGDTLAMARGVLPDSSEHSIPGAPR